MTSKKLRLLSYFGSFFAAFYVSIPAYINSSFLKNFLGEKGIGWFYALASFITIVLMVISPRLIRRFGNVPLLAWSVLLSLVVIVPLAFPLPTLVILIAFSLYIILGYLVRYLLDVYLEKISENKITGFIRGIYLTFYNFAWLISPFLAAYLVNTGNFRLVYGVAGLLLLPLFLISLFGLKENHRIKYKTKSLGQEIKRLWLGKNEKTRSIYSILLIDFLLNLFYSVMVVYMPIYLHDHIGLSWTDIGLAFTVMLVPFVLFELPLGKIADKWLGEKEMLIGGILIITLTTIACSFLKATDWLSWAIILFFTRTGAAVIEIMKETYLFKKISATDTGVISLSRISIPLSYIIGPIFVSLILLFLNFNYIFFVLGLIMLGSLHYALQIKDTK